MDIKKFAFVGPALVLFAASLWGSVGIFTKQLYAYGFSPIQVSFLRSLSAAIILVPFMLIRHRNDMKIRAPKDLLYFLLAGTFGLALCYTTYFMTIKASTISIAAVMLYSAPIIVTILAAVIFKERITATKIISMFLAFAGCIIMSGILGGSVVTLSFKAIIVGFLSGLGYALYSVGSRLALKQYSTYAVTAYTFIFAVLGMLPLAGLNDVFTRLYLNPSALLPIFEMGIMCTVVPYTIYVLALTYVEVSKASIISIIEPVVATIIGLVLFNEIITTNVIVAILIILLSVVFANVDFNRKKNTEEYKLKGTRSAEISVGKQAERLLSEKYNKRMKKQNELEQAFVEKPKE